MKTRLTDPKDDGLESCREPDMLWIGQLAFRQLDSNGTARVGGGHRGVTEIVRSLESTASTS